MAARKEFVTSERRRSPRPLFPEVIRGAGPQGPLAVIHRISVSLRGRQRSMRLALSASIIECLAI